MKALIKSRRKPRLRVVGSARQHTRHAVITCDPSTYADRILEVFTFAEWAEMEEWERPADSRILPGIGFYVFHRNPSCEEAADVRSVWEAAHREYYGR